MPYRIRRAFLVTLLRGIDRQGAVRRDDPAGAYWRFPNGSTVEALVTETARVALFLLPTEPPVGPPVPRNPDIVCGPDTPDTLIVGIIAATLEHYRCL